MRRNQVIYMTMNEGEDRKERKERKEKSEVGVDDAGRGSGAEVGYSFY